MSTPLNLLIIEDKPADFRLLVRHLEQHGLAARCHCVASLEELEAAVAQGGWDAVLSDYSVPKLDFQHTLSVLQGGHPDLPLILVSGCVGEERAVELLKLGVWDFVLKDSMTRLVPAIERSLRDAAERHERRRTQATLRKSEDRYRNLVETAIGWVWEVDAQGRYIYASPRVWDLLGYQPKEVLGRTPFDLMPADEAQRVRVLFEGIAAARQPFAMLENANRHRDGHLVVLESNGVPILSPEGTLLGYRGMHRDITERKQAQTAVRESAARYGAMVKSVADAIISADSAGRIISWNPGAERISGYPESEILGQPLQFLMPARYHDRHSEGMTRVAAGGPQHIIGTTVEVEGCRKDGSEFPLNLSLSEWQIGGQKFFTAIIRDITARKQAETAIRESEQRWRFAIEGAGDGLWDWNVPASTVFFTKRWKEMLGFTEDEIGTGLEEWRKRIHPDDLPQVIAGVQAHFAGTSPYYVNEHRVSCKDSSYKWILDRGLVIERDAAGQPLRMIGTHADITERKRAEASNARLVMAVEQASEMVVITDVNGTILYANPAFEKITGYSCEEVIGQNPRMLKSGKHDAEFYRRIWATLNAGEVWRGRVINKRKNGTFYEEDSSISPVLDATGKVVNYVAVKRDVTEELKREAQLLRSERLESIGSLASGIAHDLNNILAPIMMAVQILRLKPIAPGAEKLLDVIEGNSQRGAGVVKQILTFAQGVEGKRTEVQMRYLIKEMVKIIKETFPKSIRIDTLIAPDLWTVVADSTKLDQLLLNLCINARDAMPEGGLLSLYASNIEVDKALARQQIPEAKAGPYTRLTVADTGTGIPPEILGKVFDPFFTTKPKGKGTGLGLSTVIGIVRGHSGFLQVHSDVGHGTSFDVFLPAIIAETKVANNSVEKSLTAGRGELILVVDDEETIRKVAHEVLILHGYSALLAADGVEALTLFGQHPDEIKAVITDMMMPNMGGFALTQALRKMAPKTPILACSGLAAGSNEESKQAEMKELGVRHYLSKPYSADQLMQALQDLLKEKSK